MNLQNKTFVQWLLIIFAVLFLSKTAMSQDYDIYIYDIKSGETKQISNIPDLGEYMPDWSPDGKKIVHNHWSPLLGNVIMITDVNTGESTILEGAEESNNPAWSPNGQWIAFDHWPIPDGIYLLPPEGGTPRFVIEDAFDPDWSPNSERIVFYRPSDRTIQTVDINNPTDMTVVANVFTPYYAPDPRWSPNGLWIAYGNPEESENKGLWKVRVNPGGERLSLPEPIYIGGNYYNPAWSNNSKQIAFISCPDDGIWDYDIWIISVDDNSPIRLTGLVGYGDYNPSFSRNGQYIAYSGYTETQLPKTKPDQNVEPENPTEISFLQNYPNPFNPLTKISYEIPEAGLVILKVYDLMSNEVAELVNGKRQAGKYEVEFTGENLASGVYLYRIQVRDFVLTKKMLLLK